jgi:hypothetical protein
MRCNHHEAEKKPCSCVETYDAIVAGEDIPKLAHYCAIVREAAKHPVLLSLYASDLITHDRAELTDYAGPFLWVLRDCGTVIVKPCVCTRARCGCHTVKGILHAFGWENTRWYWWDGAELHSVRSPERAHELLDLARERARRHAKKAG